MEKNRIYETERDSEKVILTAVENDRSQIFAEQSLDELAELAYTAGVETVGRLIQKRDKIHPAHYLGKGKIDELKDLIALHGAGAVICDDELTPGQMRRLNEILDVKVIDRTMLILDIFAGRAQSMEGKVQVELAQLKYSLSHLAGLGNVLSRLGGGIGTRGPGETKLETDRRHIRSRISDLQAVLREVRTQRGVQRGRREKNNIPIISLVGYTNAGKSTLMNFLTNAGVLEEDKLFATLDTTTRKTRLPGGTEVLLTDTVGFIQKLPHHLVQAFRATLEELEYADVLLHIVDASNPMRENHMSVVYDTLRDLGCGEKTVVTLFNKMDLNVEVPLPNDKTAVCAIPVSAKTGDGTEALLGKIEEIINSSKRRVTVCVPYSEGHLLGFIRKRCEILREEHTEEGTLVELYADAEVFGRLKDYLR